MYQPFSKPFPECRILFPDFHVLNPWKKLLEEQLLSQTACTCQPLTLVTPLPPEFLQGLAEQGTGEPEWAFSTDLSARLRPWGPHAFWNSGFPGFERSSAAYIPHPQQIPGRTHSPTHRSSSLSKRMDTPRELDKSRPQGASEVLLLCELWS